MAELTQKQYLDLAGLKTYDAKVQTRTNAAIKVVDDKVITLDATVQENTGKIAANENAIADINNVDTGILKQSKNYTDNKVEEAVEAVKSSLASALTYKGQKATVDELPTEGNKSGDVWNVATTDKGTSAEYVWVIDEGTSIGRWEELGTAVDLSGYATKTQVAADITTAKNDAIAAAATDATTKANAAITTAATDATTKANKALEDAKTYADGLATNYDAAGTAQSVYNAMGSISESEIAELFASK